MCYPSATQIRQHCISWLILLLNVPLVGCTSSNNSFLGLGRAGQKTNNDSDQLTAVSDMGNSSANGSQSIEAFAQSLAESINAPGAFEQLAATPMSEVLADPMEWASNDTIDFFGYSVDSMLDKLTSYKMNDAREQALAQYATLGDHLASIGVYSAADLDFSDFRDTIARYEQYMQNIDDAGGQSGDIDSVSSDSIADAAFSLVPSAGEFIDKESHKSCDSSAQDSRNFGHMCGHCIRENDINPLNRVKAENHCIACKAEDGAIVGNLKRGCFENSALPPPPNQGPM